MKQAGIFYMLLGYFFFNLTITLSRAFLKMKRESDSELAEKAISSIAQGNLDDIKENELYVLSYQNLT